MRRKKISTIVLCVGIVLAALALWRLTRPEVLGNISHSFSSSEPETNTSTVSFFAEEGDRIRFYYTSDIEQGELEIIIYDSEGNLIKKLDQAKELVTYLTMRRDDTYTLAAEYRNFAGSFRAEVCSMK